MRVRILTAWPGSPPCGTVADLPDALAQARVRVGYAEPVAPAPSVAGPAVGPETAMLAPAEQAIRPRGKARGGRA